MKFAKTVMVAGLVVMGVVSQAQAAYVTMNITDSSGTRPYVAGMTVSSRQITISGTVQYQCDAVACDSPGYDARENHGIVPGVYEYAPNYKDRGGVIGAFALGAAGCSWITNTSHAVVPVGDTGTRCFPNFKQSSLPWVASTGSNNVAVFPTLDATGSYSYTITLPDDKDFSITYQLNATDAGKMSAAAASILGRNPDTTYRSAYDVMFGGYDNIFSVDKNFQFSGVAASASIALNDVDVDAFLNGVETVVTLPHTPTTKASGFSYREYSMAYIAIYTAADNAYPSGSVLYLMKAPGSQVVKYADSIAQANTLLGIH